jgi:hypothetical protein
VSVRAVASQAGGLERVELVTAPGVQAEALVQQAVRRVADKFAVPLPPEMIAVSQLPAVSEPMAVESAPGAASAWSAAAPEARVRIDDISVSAVAGKARAEVSLLYEGRKWDGVHEGPNTPTRRYCSISDATLSGIGQILGQEMLFSLEDLKVVTTLDGPVVVVVVELTGRMEGKRLTGSCSAAQAHGSMDEAVVRATLQAVNRLFARFAAGPLAH